MTTPQDNRAGDFDAEREHHQQPTSAPVQRGGALPRAWQRMLSGRRLDLLAPDPNDIDVDDIAHGLARVARWNGQTTGPDAFSVAQHSVLVAEICDALADADADADATPDADPGARAGDGSSVVPWGSDWRCAALMHDAPEYVIGDLISPFKSAIGEDYKAIENRLLAAIHRRFGLPDVLPGGVAKRIKQADRIAAYFEATRLAGFEHDEAAQFFGDPPTLPDNLFRQLDDLRPKPTSDAHAAFLSYFARLGRNI